MILKKQRRLACLGRFISTDSEMETADIIRILRKRCDYYLRKSAQELNISEEDGIKCPEEHKVYSQEYRKFATAFNLAAYKIDEYEKQATMGEKVSDILERMEIEVEGAKNTWWYVCPVCHGEVDQQDSFCRWCGQGLK